MSGKLAVSEKLADWVEQLWYQRKKPPAALKPLSSLFHYLANRRRRHYQQPGNQYECPLPVIVVGNLTVGGTGKSPLTAWLVECLRTHGYQPVIITRGYGASSDKFPLLVMPETPASVCGDEPLMLARQTGLPVVVDPDRARGAAWAAAEGLGNILVCDDGLQHYRLGRTLELAVFDGGRGAGNGGLLPAGPLREPLQRLASVTAVVINGEPQHPTFATIQREAPAWFTMELQPQALRQLTSGIRRDVGQIRGKAVHGVAGIGNPERFFSTLEEQGADVRRHAFPDHHQFQLNDFPADDLPVVMTAKDGVKCEAFARSNWWVLEVSAKPRAGLESVILSALNTLV